MGIRTPVSGSEGPIEAKLDRFLKLRSINGLSESWLYDVRDFLENYIKYIDGSIDEDKTLDYLKLIQDKYSITSYRKRVYQIRKFLTFLNIDWASNILPPSEPIYIPKRISSEQISNTIVYFKENTYYLQCKSLILMGVSCGARAEELYQLKPEDIDLDNRTIHINHNPKNHQFTKTKASRISFFNQEAKQALIEYLEFYNRKTSLESLYSQSHITRLFRKAPIQVKDLRKYFSQTWDRLSGPTGTKKLLMGHSIKSDVDCKHYNGQSEEDLKKIYDRVMNNNIGITNEGG